MPRKAKTNVVAVSCPWVPAPAAPTSPAPVASCAGHQSAPPAMDLWIDLITDLVVAEVSRERQGSSEPGHSSRSTIEDGGAA